jgi:predicted RNA-binding protein YlxR (DUF448 family)
MSGLPTKCTAVVTGAGARAGIGRVTARVQPTPQPGASSRAAEASGAGVAAMARPGKLEPMSEPVRTCIGCRKRAVKSELVRLVWRGAAVWADLRQTEPGRGAYLHQRVQCLEAALRKRAIGRALRVANETLDLEQVRVTLSETGHWA